MGSKRRNMFYENKTQETTEKDTCNLPPFCDCMPCRPSHFITRMPKINEDIVVKYEDESTHEIGQEASWSGFEVEVENDSNESTEQAKSTDSTEEVELVGSNNCINSQIVVECDDRHQRSTGNVISIVVLGKTNVSKESIDEYSAFGLYVEQELKKITNPYALQVTKYKINQVLFEATTGAYHRGLDSSLKNQT
ncbi:hypothetical protein AAG570_010989 [Ranatra chinensis]|uniref:Uncharacterized protein n=1 Tax=Ranatra chinensis TaxID=642074 RepID=A0ABD0YJH2_9HEMI